MQRHLITLAGCSMNKLKSNGPKIDPCGNPRVAS